ncbi:MAG: hypothetical protein V4492_02960 [Chlamydiota bacterium]
MTKLQIANAFFEWELEQRPLVGNLYDAFHAHPVFLQLQFLSALYCAQGDGILLSDLPPQNYWDDLQKKGVVAPLHLPLSSASFAPFEEVESWGYSPLIAEWAEKNHLHYPHPNWDVVAEVNSKAFSFANSPKLRGATLLRDEMEAIEWAQAFPGKKVFKTCHGYSGRGHRIVEEDIAPVSAFLRREFLQGRVIIAEPWVSRVRDFSTQWKIGEGGEIEYVGATLCENDERGVYLSNCAGKEEALFGGDLHFLHAHKEYAADILKKMAWAKYFGNVGIDAMLYKESGGVQLHPVVEVNARKTMGWAALMFQQRHFPSEVITFRIALGQTGYLPFSLGDKTRFKRNLLIQKCEGRLS